MTKIANRLTESWFDGAKKLEGKYFSTGERLPDIFYKAGLRDIMAEVQTDAYITSDPRRKLDDVRDELEFSLETFKERKKMDDKAMIAGGASKKNIALYRRWFEKWTMSLLKDEARLRSDTTFGTGGMFLVAGRKQ